MLNRRTLTALVAVLTLTGLVACKGKDLTLIKTQALGLISKFKPQIETGLAGLSTLLDKAKDLPAEMPAVAGLVTKLTAQKDNLTKLQGLLGDLPGKVDEAVKAGKEDDLKKLVASVEADMGAGLTEATAAIGEGDKVVAAAEAEVKVKDAAKNLGPTLSAALKEQWDKIAALLASAKAMPPETPGIAELITTLEASKAEGEVAAKSIEGLNAKIEAAGADMTAAQAVVDAGTAEATAATKKLETDLAAIQLKFAALSGAAAKPADAAADFDMALTTGFEVKGAPAGAESQLVTFVQDATKEVDKTTWFDFDRLSFETGSAKLDLEKSQGQLNNVVEIMKAFPNLKLKLGGYTDNTGSAAANKKLSQHRAEAVVAALVAAGVAKDRLEAEGYGPEFPVCPANDTPECQAKNRRIAMRVTAK